MARWLSIKSQLDIQTSASANSSKTIECVHCTCRFSLLWFDYTL